MGHEGTPSRLTRREAILCGIAAAAGLVAVGNLLQQERSGTLKSPEALRDDYLQKLVTPGSTIVCIPGVFGIDKRLISQEKPDLWRSELTDGRSMSYTPVLNPLVFRMPDETAEERKRYPAKRYFPYLVHFSEQSDSLRFYLLDAIAQSHIRSYSGEPISLEKVVPATVAFAGRSTERNNHLVVQAYINNTTYRAPVGQVNPQR